MKQGKWASAIESWSNTMLGFGLSLFLQWAFFAWWLKVPLHILDNLTFALLMTAVSFARGYAVRRFFERIGLRFKMSAAFLAVMAERLRQQITEGWSHDHDDKHERGVLAAAGACYAIRSHDCRLPGVAPSLPPSGWPWADEWWKPQDFRRNLIKAAALIIAEIEKFDRAKRVRTIKLPPFSTLPAFNVEHERAISQGLATFATNLEAAAREITPVDHSKGGYLMEPFTETVAADRLAAVELKARIGDQFRIVPASWRKRRPQTADAPKPKRKRTKKKARR